MLDTGVRYVAATLFAHRDEGLWLNDPLASGLLAERLADLCRGFEDKRVLCAVNTPALAERLQALGVETVLAEDAPPAASPWVPEGIAALAGRIHPDAGVAAIDLRCLSLKNHHLERLIEAWDGESVQTYAYRPSDNPCQLKRFVQVRGVGHLVLFEDWGREGAVRFARTRPFSLPAPLDARTLPGSAWDLDANLRGVDVREDDVPKALAQGRPVVVFERDGRGRALLPEPWLASAAPAGVPVADLCGVTIGSVNASGAVAYAAQGRHHFALIGDAAPDNMVCLHLSCGEAVQDVLYRAGEPGELPALPSGPGIPYSIVHEAKRGTYHLALDMPNDGRLWRRSCGMLVNATGKPIHGRQAFPDCLKIESSAAVGRFANLLSPDPGRVRAIPENTPFRVIRDKLGVLDHTLSASRGCPDNDARTGQREVAAYA